MVIAKIQMTKRIDQLSAFGEEYPAFTAASNAARERKFAMIKPKNRITIAITISGNKCRKRDTCSCKPAMFKTLRPTRMKPASEIQKIDRLKSSDIDGSAAIRNTRDAPASSDKRSSLVSRRVVRTRYFSA